MVDACRYGNRIADALQPPFGEAAFFMLKFTEN